MGIGKGKLLHSNATCKQSAADLYSLFKIVQSHDCNWLAWLYLSLCLLCHCPGSFFSSFTTDLMRFRQHQFYSLRPASSETSSARADQSISPRPLATDARKRSWSRLAKGIGTFALSAVCKTRPTSFSPKDR